MNIVLLVIALTLFSLAIFIAAIAFRWDIAAVMMGGACFFLIIARE